ncbi:hypothetical protein ABPG72_006483 [Tetrahymena utriculariae]
MAHSFLANLSENPEKILKYQIKKFCFQSMSHKIYSNGGSLGFVNLIQGNYSFIQQNYQNLMEYLMFYSRNIKLPEVLDQRGIIDFNIAFMVGQQEIDINIVTVEGFTIMGKCRFFNYPLSEIELIDGFRACDFLSVVEFSFNQKILEDLQQKRNQIDQRLLKVLQIILLMLIHSIKKITYADLQEVINLLKNSIHQNTLIQKIKPIKKEGNKQMIKLMKKQQIKLNKSQIKI